MGGWGRGGRRRKAGPWPGIGSRAVNALCEQTVCDSQTFFTHSKPLLQPVGPLFFFPVGDPPPGTKEEVEQEHTLTHTHRGVVLIAVVCV